MSPDEPSGEPAESMLPEPGSVNESAKSLSQGLLVPGHRWHNYQVGDRVESPGVPCFHAVNVGMLEDVILEVRPLDGVAEIRAKIWAGWQEKKIPGLQSVIEAIMEGDWRVEAFHLPAATTLREWLATHRPELDDISEIVRQCVAAVGALHERGAGHFNLSLDTIRLNTSGIGLHVEIGGLDQATAFEQPGLVALRVDPFYAPPEAAGLTRHSPGRDLAAWDWWSLGRVVQEMVLGRHVLGVVLGRDVSVRTLELQTRAMDLLLERDKAGPRAGAVERMPPMCDELAVLLRGLLSSARVARWHHREIEAWLRREEVKERYQLHRDARLFRWNDRTYSIEEAADYFSGEETWREGVEQVFAVKDPTRLIHFLGSEPVLAYLRKEMDELGEMMQLPAWRDLPVEVVRTVLAAAAWLQLGETDTRMRLCGRAVTVENLRAIHAGGTGLAVLRAATATAFVQLVGARDPESARVLGGIGSQVNDVFALGAKLECVSVANAADLGAVYAAALATDDVLAAKRTGLRTAYACSRQEGIEAIFQMARPSRKEAVLLAALALDPERHGFVTHREWKQERYVMLRERGDQVAGRIFWSALGRALRAGPLVFGRLRYAIAGWVVLSAAVLVIGPQPWASLVAAGMVAALLGLRLGVCARQRRGVAQFAPGTAAWTLRSGHRRCQEEVDTILPGETAGARELRAELQRIETEIRRLALEGATGPIRPPSRAMSTWAASGAGWVLACAALIWSVSVRLAQADARRAEEAAAASATEKFVADAVAARPASAERMPPAGEHDFGAVPAAHEVWIFEEPSHAAGLTVIGQVVPTPDQVAAAVIDGQRLLLPFGTQSARGLIAIPVWTEGGAGVILFDAKQRRVVDRHIFKLAELPADSRVWYELNRRKVLYLGEAPPPVLGPAEADLAAMPESGI